MDFRWNDWNREHATRHGISKAEVEHVVRFARRPYPERRGRHKWYVVRRGTSERYAQVVYLTSAAEPDTAYVIHAMPLGDGCVHRRRRRGRKGI